MALRYRHANTYMVWRTVKKIMADEQKGALTREEAAIMLHEAAVILVETIPVIEQLELLGQEESEATRIWEWEDTQDKVKKHLSKNAHPSNIRRIK